MESLERTAEEVRSELFVSGLRIFGDISSNVREEISSFAPAAAVKLTLDYSWSIHLDSAELTISPPAEVEAGWASEEESFDVVAAADIEVKGFIRRHDYEGRSHSLWFCDATHEGRFEWYEVAFMASPLVKPNTFQYRMSPYALSPRSAARRPFEVEWEASSSCGLSRRLSQVTLMTSSGGGPDSLPKELAVLSAVPSTCPRGMSDRGEADSPHVGSRKAMIHRAVAALMRRGGVSPADASDLSVRLST